MAPVWVVSFSMQTTPYPSKVPCFKLVFSYCLVSCTSWRTFSSVKSTNWNANLFSLIDSGSLQSSAGLVADRVLFYKHADANFYSAWPYVFGRAISQIPQVRSLLEALPVFSHIHFIAHTCVFLYWCRLYCWTLQFLVLCCTS